MLKIENNNKTELKKLDQYWKNIIFKYDFGNNLLNKFLFLLKKLLFLNQYLETENLYNINKELTSIKNIKVYKVLDKNIKGIKMLKLNSDKK